MVMAMGQSAYDQGVYGLVSSLGSLVVRTLFQPVEEAAFTAFSKQGETQPLPTCAAVGPACHNSNTLSIPSSRCTAPDAIPWLHAQVTLRSSDTCWPHCSEA